MEEAILDRETALEFPVLSPEAFVEMIRPRG